MSPSAAKIDKATSLRAQAELLNDMGCGREAFRLFFAAAKLGDEQSQVFVGYDYAYGFVNKPNSKEALLWWKRAYRQGSWDAAYNLGMYYRDAKEWAKAVKWFDRAVRAGDPDGLIEIAKVHLRYLGDRDEGLKYLTLASAEKDRLTKFSSTETERMANEQEALSPGDLLYMEAEQLDEQSRYAESMPLLERGAEIGDASCQTQLGNYLSDGRKGVKRNRSRAIELYLQVYRQENQSGAYNLAKLYHKEKNFDEAILWYERAVELRDHSAHLDLAKIWLHVRGNKAKAIEHLEALFPGSLADSSEADRDEARAMLRRLSLLHD